LVSSFSGGGGGSGSGGSPLPVTLASFTAKKREQTAVLNWTTTSESHNQGFEIQRSVNNLTFNTIGFVDGVGTTYNTQSYTFTDTQMGAGNNYYRLKQIDLDGTFNYSRMVQVENLSGSNTRIYPMPVSNLLSIDYEALQDEDLQITLVNQSGIVQYSKAFKVVKGSNTLTLDFAPVSSGAYLIKLTSPKATVTRHVFKQ
jgi:hypothetical protein